MTYSTSFGQPPDKVTLSGTVAYYNNIPFTNGILTFKQGKKALPTLTDSNGHFEIHLPKGTYKLSFVKIKEFNYKDTTINVSRSNTDAHYVTHVACFENPVVKATKDISLNTPKLILISRTSSVKTFPHISYTHADTLFQKKYDVTFQSISSFDPYYECLLPYNKTVFKHLDLKFGTKWRNEVRRDVVGLE